MTSALSDTARTFLATTLPQLLLSGFGTSSFTLQVTVPEAARFPGMGISLREGAVRTCEGLVPDADGTLSVALPELEGWMSGELELELAVQLGRVQWFGPDAALKRLVACLALPGIEKTS